MATRSMNPLNRLVRHVRHAALGGAPCVLSDGRLMESFLACRDEASFEMLVKRHGPMVLGVCRRVIGNLHDAEDAFQAVFLVLARKAGSIVPRDLVGNWLHGVAYRTALQARNRLGRRRAHERQVKDMPQPTVAPEFDLQELHDALDQELNELPEKYRVPIVLCDLEGRSRKDVAGDLRIPEGTLCSRLAAGREMLARRLARQGLVHSGAALATALAGQAASAAIQPALLISMVKAATLAAVGQSAAGLVSAEAVALSQGVLKTMFLNKLKVLSFVFLGVVLGSLGAGVIGLPGSANSLSVFAAPPGEAIQARQSKQATSDDQEPLDGKLLLDQQVQKELHLSKNQVSRVEAVSKEVDAKNSGKQQEIQQLQKQIEEIQKRIAKLEHGIEKDRARSLSKAAPEILSAQALKRLREIQRQQRSLDELLEDSKFQRMLKLNDEQLKKIETVLKTEPRHSSIFLGQTLGASDRVHTLVWGDANMRLAPNGRIINLTERAETWLGLMGAATIASNEQTLRKLFDVLTESQRKALLQWVGEPYQSQSWQMLRGKDR
jgi:RNA polymerase sigma factor (sigma-70 family)